MGVNYGCDKVRFPAPVKVGARVRGHGLVLRAEPAGEGVQVTVRVTVEIEGSDRPGCVVDTISRLFFNE
jgi:acyl dehydratase